MGEFCETFSIEGCPVILRLYSYVVYHCLDLRFSTVLRLVLSVSAGYMLWMHRILAQIIIL